MKRSRLLDGGRYGPIRQHEDGAYEFEDRDGGPVEFDESGESSEKWARAYDELNGAPESEEDR